MEKPELQQSYMGIEYRYACFSERHPQSCEMLADFLKIARKQKYRSAKVSLYACNGLKYGPSCYEAALNFVLEGFGLLNNEDYKRGLEYFDVGCEYGHARSCYRKGQMLVEPKGTFKGVKSDPAKGMETLELACSKGSFDACYEASVHYLTGKTPGIEANYRKAFLLSKTACEFGYRRKSCHNLAAMYEHGIATKKDPETAKKIRETVLN